MVTETFIRFGGEKFLAYADDLGNGNDFDITDNKIGSNAIAETYTVGGSCDVKHVADPDGDFASPNTTITIDSFSGAGISEGNATPILDSSLTLRITNTSGSAADFIVHGRTL